MKKLTGIPVSSLAWAALIGNAIVILQGAIVRATGSGAGCGRHWPTCNGQVIPLAHTTESLIEFSHRLVIADGSHFGNLAVSKGLAKPQRKTNAVCSWRSFLYFFDF